MTFEKGNIPWNKNTHGLMPKPWNKDLTKDTDEKVNRSVEKMRDIIKQQFKNGRKVWNKNKKLHYDVWNKNKTGVYSKERIDALRKDALNQFENASEAVKNKIIKRLNTMSERKTSIELKVENQLEGYDIDFIYQYSVGGKFLCDFYLPNMNLIIEADGDYWHSLPDNARRDKSKDAYLKACGYKVVRIPEHVIKQHDFDVLKFI